MDFSELRATALARNWKRMLELMADVALRPTLPDAEIDGERRAMLTALRSRQDQPFPLALDTVMSRVYGEHPYGRPILGRPAALQRIDRAGLLAYHQRFYRGAPDGPRRQWGRDRAGGRGRDRAPVRRRADGRGCARALAAGRDARGPTAPCW